MVGYGLEGEGYHRELVVSVHTEERHGGKETECLIVVNVTSNFYIDLDQVDTRAFYICTAPAGSEISRRHVAKCD